MEYVAASVCAIALAILAVARPALYADRIFKPVYNIVLAGLAVALATVYVCDGVVSNDLVYAFAGLGLVSVALLPVSGKLTGHW